MATITGIIERIKFRNEENGYTVLAVSDNEDGDEVVMVGTFAYVSEGDMIRATGHLTEHPVYGEQLQVEEYEMKAPEDLSTVERYLGSGAIKGVGAALASRIVRHFKADTLRVMEEEPERLSEIKGISERMAMAIGEQMEEKRGMRQAMMFLQGYGISVNLAVKIYQKYGPSLYGIIRENPYRLADDIQGVGFKMADEIAQKVGILTDSDYRMKAGIFYTLLSAAAGGHTYLPLKELKNEAGELLKVHTDDMDKYLMDLQMEKRLVVKGGPDERQVYGAQYYYLELNTARMLHDLNIRGNTREEEIRSRLNQVRQMEQVELDELQEQAVVEAVNSGLLILTGGPGTGKTTTITAMIRYFEMEEMEVLLAAPTGRAAKRMTEATGREARTIHRLLELTPSGGPAGNDLPGMESKDGRPLGMHFERNEENPLDADVVIIDEMSMVDIHLMHALLRAVSVGTRLILVGDVDQLPSVGPGNVLRDMIDSGCFNVVKLTRIFRQAAKSDIIVNAHRINDGLPVDLGKRSLDFLFIRRENPDQIISAMITLVQKKLPGYVHADPFDIQVMTPMRKGALGVEMQIKNNYQMEWEICNDYGIPIEQGSGVFNGDMGVIREINEYGEILTVEFDEKRRVEYSFKQLEELELAYAITIHKSQGSEYPAAVIPMYSGPRMLMTRNLLYTAVTRAKSCVCLVGLPEIFSSMAANCQEQKRYSGLKNRIEEIYEAAESREGREM